MRRIAAARHSRAGRIHDDFENVRRAVNYDPRRRVPSSFPKSSGWRVFELIHAESIMDRARNRRLF